MIQGGNPVCPPLSRLHRDRPGLTRSGVGPHLSNTLPIGREAYYDQDSPPVGTECFRKAVANWLPMSRLMNGSGVCGLKLTISGISPHLALLPVITYGLSLLAEELGLTQWCLPGSI